MARSIDIAKFTCPNCSHISTPPEAINAIPHQMEKYEVAIANDLEEKLKDVKEQAKMIADLKKKHNGNDFSIDCTMDNPDRKLKDKKVIRVQRSYSKVALQSGTVLEESDHIILACPQCNTTLYEVKFK